MLIWNVNGLNSAVQTSLELILNDREVRHFDSGVGMVSRAVTARYPHPANSTVGDYPSMNEVSYR